MGGGRWGGKNEHLNVGWGMGDGGWGMGDITNAGGGGFKFR